MRIQGGHKTVKDLAWREATPEEEPLLVGWLRWAYEHGKPVVKWVTDGSLTIVPEGYNRLSADSNIVLHKEGENGKPR